MIRKFNTIFFKLHQVNLKSWTNLSLECIQLTPKVICGSFFLSLLFSCSQVVNFLKSKHQYMSENIAIFHSKDDRFSKYLFLNEKKRCHLMIFSWRLESKRTRVRGKSNHKFRAKVARGYLFVLIQIWNQLSFFRGSAVVLPTERTCEIYQNKAIWIFLHLWLVFS